MKSLEQTLKDETLKKIFFELSCAMDGIKQDLLSQILSQYPHTTDQDILEQLCSYNLDFDPDKLTDDEVNYKRKFVFIGPDFCIETALLKNIEKIEQEGEYGGKSTYGIMINRDLNNRLYSSNKKVFFKSRLEREKEFAKLKKHLEVFNVAFK